MTYIAFGLLNVLVAILSGTTHPVGELAALPVFAAFSLPITVPTTLLFAWLWYRQDRVRNDRDAAA